jgi:hypothetical protein
MSAGIHGKSHTALKYFRKTPAALAVYWIYLARSNQDGVAWPSLAGLAKETGWNKATCQEAREFLVKHHALEHVTDYVRPSWRKLEPKKQLRQLNLDKSEYYHPTGYIDVGSKRHWLLYFGGETESDIDEPAPFEGENDDVLPRRTSTASTIDGVDHRRHRTELNTISELDSKNTEDEYHLSEMEKRVTGILTQLKMAKIGFSKAQFKKRKTLVTYAIDAYGYQELQQAIKEAKSDNAKWWSYVVNRLEAKHVEQDEGLKYITGKYAAYIDH